MPTIKEKLEELFEEEPSSDDPCLKIKIGNGPFADRHAKICDVKNLLNDTHSYLIAEIKEWAEKEKNTDSFDYWYIKRDDLIDYLNKHLTT